jgi:hypothetical protein
VPRFVVDVDALLAEEPDTLDVLSGDMTLWALLDVVERNGCVPALLWAGLPSSKLKKICYLFGNNHLYQLY